MLDLHRLHYSSRATKKRGQARGHKSARSGRLCGTDLCPRGAALDGDVVTARERERWPGTPSPSQPRTHCQPREWLPCCPPPSFFHLHLVFFLPPSLAKETSNHGLKGIALSQDHSNTAKRSPIPQDTQRATHCLMLPESVDVQYVPNFPLHQPSSNQLWITIVF